jgi:hypothetical protein
MEISKTTKTLIYISIVMGVLVLLSKKVFSSNNTLVNGKNLVIGDSHGVMIGSRVKNAIVDNRLAKSGWSVSNLINALSSYPISNDVAKVFISIGTNGQYSKNDKIETLVKAIKEKFPYANLYIFKGSYGWSGRYGNPNADKEQTPYYQRFENAGVNILNNGLGYFATDAQAHSTNSNQAKAIISEINSYTN